MNHMQVLSAYKFFIQKYIDRETDPWSFWHRHGQTGKQAARNFLREWQETEDRLLRTTFQSEEQAIDQVKKWVKQSMLSHHLTGNCNPHSLKNYILAFYDAVNHISVHDEKTNEALFNEYFANKWKSTEPYIIESNYNRISGIEENSSILGVPAEHAWVMSR